MNEIDPEEFLEAVHRWQTEENRTPDADRIEAENDAQIGRLAYLNVKRDMKLASPEELAEGVILNKWYHDEIEPLLYVPEYLAWSRALWKRARELGEMFKREREERGPT